MGITPNMRSIEKDKKSPNHQNRKMYLTLLHNGDIPDQITRPIFRALVGIYLKTLSKKRSLLCFVKDIFIIISNNGGSKGNLHQDVSQLLELYECLVLCILQNGYLTVEVLR